VELGRSCDEIGCGRLTETPPGTRWIETKSSSTDKTIIEGHCPKTFSALFDTHTCLTRDKQFCQAFAVILRRYRKKSGLTQEKLSLISGVDRSFVSEIERELKSISLSSLVKLADALDVRPSKMIRETESLIESKEFDSVE